MKFWSKATLAAAIMAVIGLTGVKLLGQAAAQGKAAPAQGKAAQGKAAASGKPTAAQFFKNVTTPTLGALSPDDFILAMGVLTDDLGLDCAD